MYLTDPTLTNKITLLKDKNLDDKLIKIIIEGGTLKSTIEELNANLMDILDDCEKRAEVSFDGKVKLDLKSKVRNGKLYVDQGIIAGCAGGGFENICDAADILKGASIGSDEFTLSVYPASTPIYMELVKNGAVASLMATGAEGVISVASNVAPAQRTALVHNMLEGKIQQARDLHNMLWPLFKNCFIESNPIPVKSALWSMGLIENELRLPLVPATEKTQIIMADTINNLGF